ncbi:MAG: hypothetical protein RMK18_03070 [Armatimonadota bacterium]|nr:hypothetical protein [Armatimonadota bacterium]MCX7776997.1 hypothetical protein [Armatimonadota bacterium]MDW8024831.1 hypothetical protein [Armatimonadota bacterium]
MTFSIFCDEAIEAIGGRVFGRASNELKALFILWDWLMWDLSLQENPRHSRRTNCHIVIPRCSTGSAPDVSVDFISFPIE